MPAHHYSATELRTNQQNARLHLLLGKLDIDDDQRHELVHQFTNGRTSSSKMMTAVECNSLIHQLEAQYNTGEGEKVYKMRRKAFSLAHELGWEHPDGKVNMERLDGFCKKFGASHKPLMGLDVKELRNMLTQLERVSEKQQQHG